METIFQVAPNTYGVVNAEHISSRAVSYSGTSYAIVQINHRFSAEGITFDVMERWNENAFSWEMTANDNGHVTEICGGTDYAEMNSEIRKWVRMYIDENYFDEEEEEEFDGQYWEEREIELDDEIELRSHGQFESDLYDEF